MRSCLIQARTKKLFKQKKRDPWKNYVSSVNVNTPSKKVWNMMHKITGKNVASPMHHIKDENGTLITDRVQISHTLGAAIEKSSSKKNYSKEFQSIKAQKEKQNINFKTNKNLRYNKKFTMRDFKRSFKKSNYSSPGPDRIHYEITPPNNWDSSYIIGHHKWNLEKWHISSIMERSSHYINT